MGKNVPELRFSEFEGEWEENRLENYLEEYIIRVPSDTNLPILTSSRAGLFLQKDYFNDREVQNEGEYGVVPFGFITYRHMSDDSTFMFNINHLVEKGLVSKEYPVFNTKGMNIYFLQQVLNHGNAFKKFAIEQKRGGTRTRLYFKVLKQFSAFLPTLPEQQKIANFLTLIDQRIQQLGRKKALLEQYKKGVMQQLFSQKIRFKDEQGGDFLEWEERRLGEVFSFFSTNSFSRSLLNTEKGSVKNIHYGDIHTKFSSSFDISKEQVPYINDDVDLSKISAINYCQEGDLVIADASEDHKDIGKAIELISLADQKVLAGLHTLLIRDINGATAIGFKAYLMQSSHVRFQIMKMATGISVLGISKSNLAKIEFPLPALPEQQKIANFLSSFDAHIGQVGQQLEAMQGYKKGLLQRMFV
jgi:type I restriction enzyme, S subunit